MLRNARLLCGASNAALLLGRPDEPHLTLAAYLDTEAPAVAAIEAMIAEANRDPMRMDPAQHLSARAICEGAVVHVEDVAETAQYRAGEPTFRVMVEELGARTMLSVPLRDARGALGAINLHRKEVRPFSADEIALVEAFAAQVAIAIENARQFRELQTRLAREAATREILEVISRSRDDDGPVFEAILERAATLCRSSYAGLALIDEDGQHLVYTASHGPALAHSKYGRMKWALNGQSSFAEAVRERRAVRIDNLADTDLYREGDPQRVAHVDEDGLRSFMAVPLFRKDEAIGAFGLAKWEVAPFSEDDLEIVSGFAAQAVIAIDNVRQFKALEALNAELGDRVQAQVGEIERMGRLKRFLPAAVADAVVSTGSETMLSSHRALLGILFCDIRGFTAFCEQAEPEETIEVLQTYHQEMGLLVAAHGAGVDHRMGDGIMVLFNDPLPCEDPAGEAVRLALAMRGRMAELCAGWRRLGHRLGFGVGVSLGYATVGMVGHEGRFDYTASGTAVNLAARLCERAEDGEILLSPRAFAAVEADFLCEPAGALELKGLAAPVEVMRALAAR